MDGGNWSSRCNAPYTPGHKPRWLTIAVADSVRYAFASRLAVLRSCPDVISRLLKSGESVLLAAKVLVIARLLHTKISKRPNPPPYLETLRNRLASLRRKLLIRIDRRFKSLNISREMLVEAMCAFSIAASSSPTDVLRHFHHLRLEAMSENMKAGSAGHENMLVALKLYIQTLRDTQAMVPSQLAHALERLKSTSLFKSQDLYALIELNLDMLDRWIGDDIKTFTPYIRHDDLTKSDAERILKPWAEYAFSMFVKGLQKRVQDVQDPQRLAEFRESTLRLWLSNHQHPARVHPAETLDGLRDVFNNQYIRIIKDQALGLRKVASTIKEIVGMWHLGLSDTAPSLWDISMTSISPTGGAKAFRENLMSRSTGRNESLNSVSLSYTVWLQTISATEGMIEKLQATKWVDDIDDLDEDGDSLDNKQVLLSEDDPRLLQDNLSRALKEAFGVLQESLRFHIVDQAESHQGRKAVFLLRTWRELRQNLPSTYHNHSLGLESIAELQEIVANAALEKPLEKYSRCLAQIARTGHLPARPLWEGDPELPTLPSPWAYRLLLEVVQACTQSGSDVWSPRAIVGLKRLLRDRLGRLLRQRLEPDPQINGHVSGKAETRREKQDNDAGNEEPANETKELTNESSRKPVNGALVNGDSVSAPDGSKEGKIQTLFDTIYLINATCIKDQNAEESELEAIRKSFEVQIEMEAKSVERMKKDAAEYWKRTSLLFALMA